MKLLSLVYKKPTVDKKDGRVTNKNAIQDPLPFEMREELIYQPVLQKWIDNILKKGGKDPFKIFDLNSWLVDGKKDGIPSDGPGTYFISKIQDKATKDENGIYQYGFECILESKRKVSKREEKKMWGKKGPRLIKVMDLWKFTDADLKILTERQKDGKDPVLRATAEALINKTKKENLYGDLSHHDYHNVIFL
jgi:hypothetical protein